LSGTPELFSHPEAEVSAGRGDRATGDKTSHENLFREPPVTDSPALRVTTTPDRPSGKPSRAPFDLPAGPQAEDSGSGWSKSPRSEKTNTRTA
jgi:hypothetical protein